MSRPSSKKGYQFGQALALRKRGLKCQHKVEIPVAYDGMAVLVVGRVSDIASNGLRPGQARRTWSGALGGW
jgi:hypothetical protein